MLYAGLGTKFFVQNGNIRPLAGGLTGYAWGCVSVDPRFATDLSGQKAASVITYNNGYITITNTTTKGGNVTASSAFFDNKIDLTNFKTLYMKMSGTVNNASWDITLTKTKKDNYEANFKAFMSNTNGIIEREFDISALEGEYYLAIFVFTYSVANIYEVEFRK